MESIHSYLRGLYLFVALCVSVVTSAQVMINHDGAEWEIGNKYMARRFLVEKGKLNTTAVINRRTDGGATIFAPDTHSEEFYISLVAPDSTIVLGFGVSKLSVDNVKASEVADGKRLEISFAPYRYAGVTWSIKMNVEMNNTDHFMHKWLEISVPKSDYERARIDYIDLERLGTSHAGFTWTHPQMTGGVGGISGYYLSLGQPVYIDGLFFGSEFPMTENEIDDQVGHIRYYSGKSFALLQKENRLINGAFTTWKAVAGATRGVSDLDLVRTDFFAYIATIATPSNVRIQYNSWYDWKQSISRENVLKSFKEMERGFTQYGMPPIDAYVMDNGWNAYGQYEKENTSGFWQFNSKFPNGLKEPSDFAHRVGSEMGLWLGPRGGYTNNEEFAHFLESRGNGKFNINSNDVVTNHKIYLEKLKQFFIDCEKKYGVDYWKLDGFSTHQAQPDDQGNYITGGAHGMYYMTEHWERWIDLFRVMRAAFGPKAEQLWLNLTCYVNPSPWHLQWSNSVWLQNSGDMARTAFPGRTRDVDQFLTYRDGRYYDFIRIRQFQFPLKNIFNHDPTYGKADCVAPNAMTADEFRTYLMMMATRGNAFWELLYSYTLMDEDQKWLVNAEVMNWIRDNQQILEHSKMFGGNPSKGNVYGYSAWNGGDGIVAVRNPSGHMEGFSFVLDHSIGVSEGIDKLHRASLLVANSNVADDNAQIFSYGSQITLHMAPGEVRIWRFRQNQETAVPQLKYVRAMNDTSLFVQFDRQMEKVDQYSFRLSDKSIKGLTALADHRSFILVTTKTMKDKGNYMLTVNGAKDIYGKLANEKQSFVYFNGGIIAQTGNKPIQLAGKVRKLRSSDSFVGRGDFGISFWINTRSRDCGILHQGENIKIELDTIGRVVFNVCEVETTSDVPINDGKDHQIAVCRERNGMIKIYVDGEINASKYDKTHVDMAIASAPITLGSNAFEGTLRGLVFRNTAYNYREVEDMMQLQN